MGNVASAFCHASNVVRDNVPDGRDVTSEYTKNGAAWDHARSYVQGLGVDSKIARIEDDGTAYYYLGDVLGSLHFLTTATGAVDATYISTAFGETLLANETTSDPHRLTQRRIDSESGNYHFRARPYDPRSGRFLGKDPLRMNVVEQHYLYALNSPANHMDPLGFQPQKENMKPAESSDSALNKQFETEDQKRFRHAWVQRGNPENTIDPALVEYMKEKGIDVGPWDSTLPKQYWHPAQIEKAKSDLTKAGEKAYDELSKMERDDWEYRGRNAREFLAWRYAGNYSEAEAFFGNYLLFWMTCGAGEYLALAKAARYLDYILQLKTLKGVRAIEQSLGMTISGATKLSQSQLRARFIMNL